MKIMKILNNNAVIVLDRDNQEKIAIGAGVGFNRGKNDILPLRKVEKLFILKENKKLQQLLLRIPEQHIILAEEIIDYAEKYLDTKLNDHIRIGLTDHLSFAIERVEQGILLKNKLLQEVKVLYREEFEIGLWAIEHIKEKLNVHLPVDEAAFIAIHIHTMKIQGGDLHETVRQTTMIRDMVETIKTCLNIPITEDDISYERLITHLRFALIRSEKDTVDPMDQDMFVMIKDKFQEAYQCALMLVEKLAERHQIELPEEEIGYITLHIERLRTQKVKK